MDSWSSGALACICFTEQNTVWDTVRRDPLSQEIPGFLGDICDTCQLSLFHPKESPSSRAWLNLVFFQLDHGLLFVMST